MIESSSKTLMRYSGVIGSRRRCSGRSTMHSCGLLSENLPENKLVLRFRCRNGRSRCPSSDNRLAPAKQHESNVWQLSTHVDRIERNPSNYESSQKTAGKGAIFQSLKAPYACNPGPDRFRNNQDPQDIAKLSLHEVNEQEVIID